MPADASRPTPEHFLTLIRQQQRGRLKIYLGFAAGVGKTYEMLQEGHRLKQQGVDVVIGIVETHGRAETAALIGDLKQVPRRKIEYHGVVLEEMDLDAVLARRPDRRPGGRAGPHQRPRQPQCQALPGRRGAAAAPASTSSARSTSSTWKACTTWSRRPPGVKVKERVPDYVLGMADQLVNVDLSAEDLRERLAAGKIYPAERVPTALDNFFTPENLTRLRELALGEIAHVLDRRRREQRRRRGPTGGAERVMVCLSSRSPSAEALLRKGARLADRLGAPWYAVYIQTPREDAGPHRRRARSGDRQHPGPGPASSAACRMQFKGSDVVSTIAAFAKEYGITHIVLGRTWQPWYRRWFGQSLIDRLLQAVRGVDLTVVDTG